MLYKFKFCEFPGGPMVRSPHFSAVGKGKILQAIPCSQKKPNSNFTLLISKQDRYQYFNAIHNTFSLKK